MGTQTTWINQRQQDLLDEISYIAFYRNASGGASTNETNLHEVGRVVPTKTRVANQIKLSFEIPADVAVCPVATITAVNSDFTQITVDDATYFYSDDETIEIRLPTAIRRNITGKSGNIITVDSPLNVGVSLVGIEISSILTRIGIIIGGNEDPDSGVIMRTENAIDRFKDETTQPLISGDIPFGLIGN